MGLVKQELRDFGAGMYTNPDGTAIPNNAARELINVRLTERGYPELRGGQKDYNDTAMAASPCRGIFINEAAASDNKLYIVVFCGGYVWYSTGNAAFTKLKISGTDIQFTETAYWDAKIWNGIMYAVNGQDPIITAPVTANSTTLKIDGTTASALVYVDQNSWPRSTSKLAVYGGRMVAAKDDDSIVYVSVPDDPEDWYDGTNNLWHYFGYEDGETVSGLGELKDGIVVTKRHFVYRWYMQGEFTQWLAVRVQGEHADYGCNWHRSIAPFTYKGRAGLAWLGDAGVIHFDGHHCREISWPIKPDIDRLPQKSPTRSVWRVSTKSQWESGNMGDADGDGVSEQLTAYSGQLQPWGMNTPEAFDAGDYGTPATSSRGTYAATGGNPAREYIRGGHIIHDFNDGKVSPLTVGAGSWGVTSDAKLRPLSSGALNRVYWSNDQNTGYWGWTSYGAARYGFILSNESTFPTTMNGYYILIDGQYNYVQFYRYTNGSWTKIGATGSVNLSGFYYAWVHRSAGGAWTLNVGGVSFYWSDNTHSSFPYAHLISQQTFCAFGDLWRDDSLTPTHEYISQPIDLAVESGEILFEYGNLITELETKGAVIQVQTQGADDAAFTSNVTAWTYLSADYSGEIKHAQRRYFRYKVLMNMSGPTNIVNPKIYGVYLGGHYISDKYNIGQVPVDIGRLMVEDNKPLGSEIEYYLETATTEGGLDGTGWKHISDLNQQLDFDEFFGSSEQWIRFKVQFKLYTYQEMPSVNEVRFEHYIGELVIPPDGWNWEGRYHLAVDENGDNVQDAVWVCDERGAWQKDEDMNVGMAAITTDRLMGALSDTGIVRWLYEGETDNGRLIDYRITTRKENCNRDEEGHFEDFDKCFRNIVPVVKSNLGFRVGVRVDDEPWSEQLFEASTLLRPQRLPIPGLVKGHAAEFRIAPAFYGFKSDPEWPTQNVSDKIYWHEDKYIYYEGTNETETRRYYTQLPRSMTHDDSFGFWLHVKPTQLDASSNSFFGMFNTAEVGNYYPGASRNQFGAHYEETAGKYLGVTLDTNTGVLLQSYSAYQFTPGQEYYIDFSFKNKVAVLRYFDGDLQFLYTPPPTLLPITTRTFEVDAFGILSLSSAGAQVAKWEILGCVPYYDPNIYGGAKGKIGFECLGLSHEYLPLRRLARA